MQPATAIPYSLAVKNKKEADLEDLLDDSMDGNFIEGVEQSFDFNPPEVMSAHAAATGFDMDFTETVVMEEHKKAPVQQQPVREVQPQQKQVVKQTILAASARDLLSGLGNREQDTIVQQP